MHRSAIVFALYLSFAIALGSACGTPGPETPGDDSFETSGGKGGAGGSSGVGGSTTGGTGGSTTGGTGGTGGVSGSAGRAAGGSAGVMGGAGRSAGGAGGGVTGGSSGAGGSTAGGPATGGAAGTMTGGAGTGTGVSCDATFAVGMDGFVRMPGAMGACYSGYAFAGGDATSMVVFPGGGTDFTKAMGMLNISGTVGEAVDPDYLGNVYFGFNVNQKVGATTKGTVAPAGTSLTVTCTGCATPAMRVQLVGAKQWCAPLTSGTAIPYASFKTECWGTAGTAYAKEPIESIQISIPGGAAAATFDFTLTAVTEQ
jgi:hypothetical protein